MTERLISTTELRRMLGGMAPSTMYRHIANDPRFPRPIKLGNLTRFREADVEQYLEGLAEAAGCERGRDGSAVR